MKMYTNVSFVYSVLLFCVPKQYQLLTDIEPIANSPMLTIMMNFPQIKLFDRRHITDVKTGVCHDSRAANNHFTLHHTSPKQ